MGKINGGCLCGKVRFSVVITDSKVSACHCGMCRKWSGGVFLSMDVKDSLNIVKGDSLGIYASSPWGKRGFCTCCGSSLFWQTADGKQTYVSYAAMELSDVEQQQLSLASEIYIDQQPGFTHFQQPGQRLTEAEVLSQLGVNP